MSTGSQSGGRWATTVAALLSALILCGALPSAAEAISRAAAERKAMKALEVRNGTGPVVVFGTPAPVRAGAVITEAGAREASTGDRRGLRAVRAPRVMRAGDEPAYLFHEDRGPSQAFEHPGRVALVGKRSGRVRISRTLRWIPLVDGRALPWFASADGYASPRYRRYERGPGAQARTVDPAGAIAAQAPAVAGPRQAVADALAAEGTCAIRISDTLGDFFDYSGVDRSRAQLGLLLEQLERLNPRFASTRYTTRSGRSPSARIGQLIERRGCREVLVYVAGGGYSSGTPAVAVGVDPDGRDALRLQDLTAGALKEVMSAHREAGFNVVVDAPYGGRLAEALRSEPNAGLILTAGSAGEPSYLYLPSAAAGGDVVRNEVNPERLLEFTNRLLRGMRRFVDAPLEVDQALTEGRARRMPSLMKWMLTRSLSLGEDGAAVLPGPPLGQVGGPPTLPGDPPVPAPDPGRPPNRAPAAADTALAVEEDTPAELTLSATDPDGDPLSYAISDPPHGQVTGEGAQRTYVPEADYSGPDEISFTVSDGSERATGTVRIAVAAVDDRPRLATSAGRLVYTENDPAAAVDAGVELGDVDSPALSGATVRVGGGTSDDRLSFDGADGIRGAYDAAARTLTLTGTATVAEYRDALRAVRFRNASEDPGAATRTVTFSAGGSEATRPVAVRPVNDPPVATGMRIETDEDVPRAVALTATDPEGDALTYAVAPGPRHGTVSGSGTARRYTPAADYSGADSFGFTVSDGHGGTDDARVDVTVAAVDDAPVLRATKGPVAYTENDAPAAVDPGLTLRDVDTDRLDTASVRISSGHREREDVLSLDPSPQNGITATWDAAAGRLTLTGDATFAEYQAALRSVEYANSSQRPPAGPRAVTFAAAGARADRSVAVTPVNDPPVATDSTASTAEDSSRALALGASDADGDPLTYTITEGPAHGSLTGTGPTRTYAPSADYAGADSLTFEVSDGRGATDSGRIDLTVTPVNDAPRLSASSSPTQYAEDGDAKAVDGGLSLVDVDDPQIAGARVTITNPHPGDELVFASGSGVVKDGASTATSLILTGPAAKADFQTALRSVRYRTTSDTPSTAARSVSFRADDGQGLGAPAVQRVSVAAVNDRPDAGDQSVDLGENTSASISLGAADPEGDALAYSIASGPAHGTLTGSGATRTYTPATDYHGSDAFTFTATDAGGATDTGTVSITVIKDNDVPSITTTAGDRAYTEQEAATLLDGAIALADPDGAHIAGARVSIGAGAAGETLSADLAGTPRITATGGGTGADLVLTGDDTAANYEAALRTVRYRNSADAPPASRTITFAATDDDGATGTATRGIAITPVNDAPVATAGSGATSEDTPLAFTVSGTDPDGDAITWSKATDAANGTVVLSAAGAGTYTPEPDRAGTDSFTFTASDGNGATDTASFDVTVAPVNDPAATVTSAGATAYVEDEADQVADGQVTVADVDDAGLAGATVAITNARPGDELVFTAAPPIVRHSSSTATSLVLTGDASKADYQTALRSVRYRTTSEAPSTDPRVVAFRADDGDGLGAASTKLVTVAPRNDAPRLEDLTASTGEDTGLTFQLSGSDPEGGSLTWAKHADPAHGTVTVNADGSGTYTPAVDYDGRDTFEFRATDADGAAATATATITVTPVPDAPALGGGAVSGALAYTENDPATALHDGIVVAEPDGGALASATVAITRGYASGQDLLEFTDAAGVTGTWDAATGTMTLTSAGGAGASAFESALRAVTYRNASENPSAAARTVTFSVTDPTDRRATLTRDIAVTPVNDPPAVGATATRAAYTENDGATPVDGGLDVTDADGELMSRAEIEITSGFVAGQDALAWADPDPFGGINRDGVSSTDRKLVLTGAFSAADYAAALRQVTYANASESPATDDRVVTFRATDATGASGSAGRTIGVTAVDDPPVATGDSATVLEDASAAAEVPVLANDADLDGPAPAIASASAPANGTATLTGGAPDAHTGITYRPDPDFCGSDSFTYTLAGTGPSRTATVAMTVTCVNDAPVAVNDTFDGAKSAVANTTLVVDGPGPATPSVTHANKTVTGDILGNDTDADGDPLTVTPGTFTTANGGSVTLSADGAFVFRPDASTDCAVTSDSFSYTVEDNSPLGELATEGSVEIAQTDCVWYVDNTRTGTNPGTSAAPFASLAEAESASGADDTVFVLDGTNTGAGLDAGGYAMDAGERLIGEHEGLTVGGATLAAPAPGKHPTLTGTDVNIIDLAAGNEIRGVEIDQAGGGVAINGSDGDAGGVIDDVKIVDGGTATHGSALWLAATSGTFTIRDLTIDTRGYGVTLLNPGTTDFSSTSIKAGRLGLRAFGADMATSSFDAITVTDATNGAVVLRDLTGATRLGDGAGIDLDLKTASGSGAAFRATNVTGLTVDGAGTDNVFAQGGPAVDIVGADGASLAFDDVTASGSTGDGINLDGLGTGSFSASGGVLGYSGIGVDVNGGSGSISYAGEVMGHGAMVVEVTARTGGAVTVSGPIHDIYDTGGGVSVSGNTGGSTTLSNPAKRFNTGTSDAVLFTNSDGHTLNLSGGGLDIDTTSGRGVVADASGTLAITGAGNTLDTGTGRALHVATTDIGAAGLTFQRISSNGAANGIRLDNTGASGGLTVTGVNGTDHSGGHIQSSTGDAVQLTDTHHFKADELLITDPMDAGVRGIGVHGFELTDSTITDAGDSANDANESAIDFNHHAGATDRNVTGTVTIDRNTLSNHYGAGVDIQQENGTISDLFVRDNVLSGTRTQNDAIQVFTYGSTGTVASVTDAAITGNTITGHPRGSGIFVGGGNSASPTAPAGTYGTPADPIEISGNRINPNGETTRLGQFGIAAGADGRATGAYRIVNNGTSSQPLRNIRGQGIGFGGAGDVDLTYVIDNNHLVQNNHDVGSGSDSIAGGPDSQILADGSTLRNVNIKARVTNNSTSQYDGSGIRLVNGNHDGRVDLRLENNNVGPPKAASPSPAIDITNGNTDDPARAPKICATIRANAAPGGTPDSFGNSTPGIVIWEFELAAGAFSAFTGLSPSPASSEQAESYLTGLNPGSALGGGYYAGKRVAIDDGHTRNACTHPAGMP